MEYVLVLKSAEQPTYMERSLSGSLGATWTHRLDRALTVDLQAARDLIWKYTNASYMLASEARQQGE